MRSLHVPHALQFKLLLDYWTEELEPLLCCWFASHLWKGSGFSMFKPEFLGWERMGHVKEECWPLEFTFLPALTLNCESWELQRAAAPQQAVTVASWSPHCFIVRLGWVCIWQCWAEVGSVPSGYSADCTNPQLQHRGYLWMPARCVNF